MPNVTRVPSLRITELDGSPDVQGVERIYTTSGYVSSVGSGTALLSLSGAGGGASSVAIQEIDGSPLIASLNTLYVTNGFLSDLGGGNALLSLSGTGGGAPTTSTYWVEDADGALSNEVVVGSTGITTAAYASRQAAAKAGRLFLPSDSFVVERDTGSVWAPWGPLFPFTAPVDGDFSWFNQGGASVATTNGGIFLSIPSSASTNFRGRTKAKTAPYTITAALLPLFYPANYIRSFGLFFTDGTKVHGFGLAFDTAAAGVYQIASTTWTNATTINANYVIVPYHQFGPVVWLRIADNNTNRVCSFSMDGVNFQTVHSVSRTDFLTATDVGFGGDLLNSNTGGLTLLSWKED